MEARKTAASRRVQDAIAMLKADHQRVHALCAQFERASGDDERKRRLAERICQELEVHAQLEEDLFYPAVRAAIGDADLMDEAQVEHESAKGLIRQIRAMSPGDALFDARNAELQAWMAKRGLTPVGAPTFAYYNDPFTPGFLRRNEILYEVKE